MAKSSLPFLRTPYNYDRDAVSDETGLECLDPSLAQQHMKDESDINTIVERFGLGYQPPTSLRVPMQGDFSDIHDYQTAVNRILAAQESFSLLPASARARFQNDPAGFVDFASDPANLDELGRMGLAMERQSEPLTVEGIRGAFVDALNTAPPKPSTGVSGGS